MFQHFNTSVRPQALQLWLSAMLMNLMLVVSLGTGTVVADDGAVIFFYHPFMCA
jgi:hypothetical protein